ncbi:MAG: hypothetical protein JXM74_07105 [Fusobacteriaceae bacterium]|nr:hypothetical protein [Fusobacteriaceae bacterium]MBN2838510.1 hypothetical protein [Fusobacteriaceae bacterium]
MKFKIPKGRMITIIDILFLVGIMFFAKMYMEKYNKNSTSLTKNGIKYTLTINNKKIKKSELLNISLKIENRKREKKELIIKQAVPFNFIIEKEGKLLYKRDIEERLSKISKKIYLNRYQKIELGSEWYGENLYNEKLTSGNYRIILYSTDFGIELPLNFEVIEEE